MKKMILIALILTLCVLFSAAAMAAEHEHVQGPVQAEDVKEPTCAEEGSYKEVIRCTICGEIMSSVEKTVSKTNDHVPALPEKENIVNATCKDEGSYDSVIRCEVCGEELSRVHKIIPKLNYHISEYSLTRTLRRGENGCTVVTFADDTIPPLVKKSPLSSQLEGVTLKANQFASGDGSQRTCVDGEERCVICGELLQPAIPHTWDAGNFHEDSPVFPWESTSCYTCLILGCEATYVYLHGGATRTYWYGDVDGDREVTPEDARLALRASVKLEQYDRDSRAFCCADYNGDGKLTPSDARSILRAAVKLEDLCSLWGTTYNIRN